MATDVIPPPPAGFQLDSAPITAPAQDGVFHVPPPPSGFTLDGQQKPGWREIPANAKEPSYLENYVSGIKKAGSDIRQSFAERPIKSALSAPFGLLEPAAAIVGDVVGGASAVLHSAIDKIPGSRHIGFDPNKTFADRRAEYAEGLGELTNPRTRIGQNATDALGAVLKPVGDLIALPGKGAGTAAEYLGASPENAQSISDQTTALLNAGLLARSMRPSEKKPKAEPTPTREQLKERSNQAYKNAEQAGAQVTEASFVNTASELSRNLKKEGLDQTLTPSATRALERINEHKGPLTIEQLETYRKIARTAQSDSAITRPADARLAGQIIEAIDDFAENLSAKDIAAGDAAQAVASLKEARSLWSRSRKAEILDDAMSSAELRASQFSGSGLENAIRTEFRQLAKNKRKMKGFNEAERAAIKRVAMGGPIENGLRQLGKLAPTGVVSGVIGMGGGAAVAGPAGAVAVPVAGMIARKGAELLTSRNAARANELMRRGEALPQAQLPNVNPFLIGSGNNQNQLRMPLNELARQPWND